ncbi:anti-sigma factor [Streptomyces sp. NPDC048361]|uniref:anti-sigma factor n=1 Tax=Streptomyces sp. NPDC048361 TaxID=3154720 RepID=UPI00341BF663
MREGLVGGARPLRFTGLRPRTFASVRQSHHRAGHRWANGILVVARSFNQAVFLASELARPPAGKVYQLWFDDVGTMRSAGLMDPGRTTRRSC